MGTPANNLNDGGNASLEKFRTEVNARLEAINEWRPDITERVDALVEVVGNLRKENAALTTKLTTAFEEIRSIGGSRLPNKSPEIPERVERALTLLDME